MRENVCPHVTFDVHRYDVSQYGYDIEMVWIFSSLGQPVGIVRVRKSGMLPKSIFCDS